MRNLRLITPVSLALSLSLAAGVARANLILNGSFESNTAATTSFNLENATFNSLVSNATAFGTAEEIDLVTGSGFGIAPQDGDWKLGIHTQTGGAFDAFSLDITSPLVSGQTYTLTFYAAQLDGFGALSGILDIGLSTSATSFGTSIFTGTPSSADAWDLMSQTFVAPNNGAFLTVRNLTSGGYSFIDNFSLITAATGVTIPIPAPLFLFLSGSLGLLGMSFRRRGQFA